MDLFLFGMALVTLILAERLTWLQFQPSSFFRPFFISDVWYLVTGGLLLSVVMRTQALPWAGVFSESIHQMLADGGVIKSAGLSRQPSGRRKLLPILIPVSIGPDHP